MPKFSIPISESQIQLPIFQKAFTHRSYLNESHEASESNERLEFLGDSVLSFIISGLLYNLRPADNEGDLTNLRSFLVKTTSLAKVASSLNLGKYLKLSNGEELSGGRDNPQLLANTYEALLGAIYLEYGIATADEFVKATIVEHFQSEIQSGPPKDAKSYLQELTQNRFKQSPNYRIMTTSGPDHARIFTVGVYVDQQQLGEGAGQSKQIAEEAAAAAALSTLHAE